MTTTIRTPFFVVSPKSYLIGKDLLELAKITDEYAKTCDSSIFFSAPPTELITIIENTEHVIVTAQSSDGDGLGQGMGRSLLESLHYIGVKATFVNHMENQMTLSNIAKVIKRSKELGIISIACADTAEEAQAIAMLQPDIILCEKYDLIGTGKTSDEDYILETIKAVKDINSSILVMEGAGITSGEDVAKLIKLGAEGTGVSSAIAYAEDKKELLSDLLSGLKV